MGLTYKQSTIEYSEIVNGAGIGDWQLLPIMDKAKRENKRSHTFEIGILESGAEGKFQVTAAPREIVEDEIANPGTREEVIPFDWEYIDSDGNIQSGSVTEDMNAALEAPITAFRYNNIAGRCVYNARVEQ